jgi:hypothetical protein
MSRDSIGPNDEILVVPKDSPSANLQKLHEKLETVFHDLQLIRHTAVTCVTTARAHKWEEAQELADVIHHHIMLDVDDQLRAVTTCIEMLGGHTEYSTGMRSRSDPDYAKHAALDEVACDCCCHDDAATK